MTSSVKIEETELPGVLRLQPSVFEDPRGAFFESFRADLLAAKGVPAFVQDNQSVSVPRTLRGLHYQLDKPQGKLVRCTRGAIFDVAVDIRKGSPTYGRWFGVQLSAQNKTQLYVPLGFGHGFCVIGDEAAEVQYKCTDYYSGAGDQRGVLWNDPDLAIQWPVDVPLLSEKDAVLGELNDDRDDLPVFPSP